MESTGGNQFKVGLFLTVGLIAILTSILLLGGDRVVFTSYSTLYAKLDQVQGLNKGSIVSLSGMTIGNIKDISFSTEKNGLVITMKIEKKYLDKITKNSQVEIRTQGALGDKFIFIIPGESGGAPLAEGDYVESAKSSDLLGMLSEKANDAAKVFEIINELEKLLKTINANGRSDKIVANLVETTQNLKSLSEDTKKLMADIRGGDQNKMKNTLDKLNSIINKVDRGEGSLGALINDPTIHEQLKAILGGQTRKQSIQQLIRSSIEKSDKN